jgi:hypothetical protein
LPPSPRSSLALLLIGAACLSGCGRSTRKPLPRADAGPPVVVVDRKVESTAIGPTSPEIEPNDTWKQAQPLDEGVRIAGVLAVGPPLDVDCYRLRGRAAAGDLGAPPDLAAVDLGAAPVLAGFVAVAPQEGSVVLDLLDEKGKVVLWRSAPAGQRATLSYLRIPEVGALVRVRRAARAQAPPVEVPYTIEYSTRLLGPDEEPRPELEPDDQPAQAVPLPPRGNVTGKLDGSDDRDLIALPALPAGATYRVELAAIAELALEVKLRAGSETLSTARGGKGGELRLRNLPGSAAQPLYLVLRAIDGASDTPYTLRVASEPALESGVEREPNDDLAHANRAVPGESIAGYLWPGDTDWYCAPEASQLGARIDAMPDVDWKLELADAAGKIIVKADAGKRGAGEELPPDPRARCVRLSARARDTAFDAPYRLTFLP